MTATGAAVQGTPTQKTITMVFQLDESLSEAGTDPVEFEFVDVPARETEAKYPTLGDLSSLKNKMVMDDPVDVKVSVGGVLPHNVLITLELVLFPSYISR